jgi:F-type H+-transporting ATPase subunit b
VLTEALGLLASETKGFGLNFDIFEANLINLAIVIGVLFYFGRGFLGGKLKERRDAIEKAITEAELRQKEAASALAEQQQKLQMAKKQAEQIRAEAQTNAESARQAVLAQSVKDIERLKSSAAQDLNSQQDKVCRSCASEFLRWRWKRFALAYRRLSTRASRPSWLIKALHS